MVQPHHRVFCFPVSKIWWKYIKLYWSISKCSTQILDLFLKSGTNMNLAKSKSLLDGIYIEVWWIFSHETSHFFRYDYDELFEATPGCKRAVHVAVEALEKQGLKVVPYKPKGLKETWKLASLYRQGDFGATKKLEQSIGPSSQIALGLRLIQWWPYSIRLILGYCK